MALLTDAFHLTRVINLPERKDRYKDTVRLLAKLGTKFRAGSVELYVAKRPTELLGFPSLGAHGCFMSHLAILRDAQQRGLESVLVMEDDCEVLSKNVLPLASLAQTLKSRPWGFVYFGHAQAAPISTMETGAQLVPCESPLQNLHLYGVHRSALPLLVEYLEACLVRPPGDPVGGPMHVDGALSMFRSFHPEFITLIAQPPLASQRSSRSDISARSFESVAGLRQAISLARKAKWLLRVSR